MRIIGIDPGYDRFGVAVLEKESGREKLLFSDCIVTSRKDDLSLRLNQINKALEKLLEDYAPEKIAMEKLFFSNNRKTAGAVAESRGVVLATAGKFGLPVIEFTPGEIKVAVTGYGASDKKQVIFMVPKLVKIGKSIKYDDEYDAIAVGLTCLNTTHP